MVRDHQPGEAVFRSILPEDYYANTRTDSAHIGFDDEFIYGEVGLEPGLRRIPHIRLMTDNAQVAFTEWAANPGKTRY